MNPDKVQLLESSGTDSPEGTLKRLTRYLQTLAGCPDNEMSIVLTDHCYARAWNWKPESIYVRPTRRIFFSSTCEIQKNSQKNLDIDVETPPPETPPPPSDLVKPLHQMEECQRLASFARPDSPEDWEEKIDKTFWSGLQSRLWSRVLRILSEEHLSRLVKSNSQVLPITRRLSIDSTSKRFRHVFASTGYDIRVIHWLHGILFDNLPREYLGIYLDALQTLRGKIPQLIDKVVSTQPTITTRSGGSINWETLGSVLKRSWDPVGVGLTSVRPKKLPGNPILIVTPSGISSQLSSRQVKWISQLNSLGTVVSVNPHFGITSGKMTMTSCMDQLVQATRAKIQEIRSDCPGRPLILVGFNAGAAFACQISMIEHVNATVCLGFPFSTAEGKRSTPDDILMDVRCPVMFVIGEKAASVRADDIEEIRERMLVQTSLVVVGTADDRLKISSRKRNEGITQGIVDRCILDEVGNFIGGILLQPHPLPLRHVHINYEGKGVRKESRKRKNSTSSSVDSCDIPGKKSRPATPTGSGYPGGMQNMPQVMLQVPNRSVKSLPGRNGHSARRSVKSRCSINPKLVAIGGQVPGNGNGGITLNIGGLASLSPVGPIKFGAGTEGIVTKAPLGVSLTRMRKSEGMGGRGVVRVGKRDEGISLDVDDDRDPTRRALPRINTRYEPGALTSEGIGPGEPSTSAITAVENSIESSDKGGSANENSMTIIPISTKLTPGEASAHRVLATGPSKNWEKTESKDLADDFGSILDIPIIFAKDDDNLTSLEKIPPPVGLGDSSKEKNPPTKVVLLSNKNTKSDKSQNYNQIVLRPAGPSRSQGPTIKSSETVKYTKIILTKKNTIINSNNSEKIILTRNKRK
ncbi:KAT8 regulatory NSL complex subunit 3 [Fopius arisanus]|uniref:KAT8 regulatory NSL complex subunit 3 n=1 Tax=Fopius arisanus TaxID=64838 RepID=A0A9R1TXJ4_9HYME|nr:PREDICTED: KAT8 regulatory NSL complex subunit 3 [Fopius arisanus]